MKHARIMTSISKQFLLADFSSKTKNNKLKLFFTSTCWYVSVCLFKNQLPENFCQQTKLRERKLTSVCYDQRKVRPNGAFRYSKTEVLFSVKSQITGELYYN